MSHLTAPASLNHLAIIRWDVFLRLPSLNPMVAYFSFFKPGFGRECRNRTYLAGFVDPSLIQSANPLLFGCQRRNRTFTSRLSGNCTDHYTIRQLFGGDTVDSNSADVHIANVMATPSSPYPHEIVVCICCATHAFRNPRQAHTSLSLFCPTRRCSQA